MDITITLNEEEQRAIACVRDSEGETCNGRIADGQECKEHLEGFVELAVEESQDAIDEYDKAQDA